MTRLWAHAGRILPRWIWGGLMLLLTNVTTMAVPQLFRRAIDGLKGGVPLQQLHLMAGLLVVVAIAGAIFRTLSRIHILYAGRDVELSLRCEFYAHLARLEPAFFQEHPTGDLMSRATNDLTQIRLMLGPGLLNLVNTIVAYATAIPLMLMISWKLTLITFAIYPPALLLMRRLGKKLYMRNRRQQQALGALSNLVQENLAGAQLVRAFVVEDEQSARFAQRNKAYFATNIDLAWTRSYMFRLAMSLASISTLLTVFFGARQVVENELTMGEIVALVEYMALLSGPTFALGWVLSLWQRGAASMARLEEIIGRPPRIVGGALNPGPISPDVRLDKLVVHFPNGQRGLTDVSLVVPAGQTLGIVGPIGGGKTTLVRALLRLVEVPAGSTFVGGHDVTELSLNALRGAFGYVPQNPNLFSKTIGENVAFGRPDASEADILTALDQAAFGLDLQALPEGLQTPVGERGLTLSGGQKQRCAMARALLLDPPILILDDSLSAVDTETESQILRTLRRLRQGRTTIIVGHRVTTVQQADNIIVLDKATIVESGRHDALIAKAGVYAGMVAQQALQQTHQTESSP